MAKKSTADKTKKSTINPEDTKVFSPKAETPTIIDKYQQKEGLYLLKLELENFKLLKSVVVNLGAHSILVIGKNERGKSSLIQAIMGTLNADFRPAESVMQGEENANIGITIGGTIRGEQKLYNAKVHFTAKNQSGRLVLTNEKDENVTGPATILKNLLSASSFDITEWMTQKKAQKLDMLKNLTGCGQQIDLINNEIKGLKATRKAKKDRYEELEGALNNHEFVKEDGSRDFEAIEKYSQPADLAQIQNEYNVISGNIQIWNNVNNGLNSLYDSVKISQERIQNTHNNIAALREQIAAQEGILRQEAENVSVTQKRCLEGEEWKRLNPLPNLNQVNQKMTEAVAHNDKFNRIGQLVNQQNEMIALKQEVETFKAKIEDQETLRNDLISKSQLPVPGLTFTDEEIFYNGLPLDELQINKTSLFDIGAEVAMALHPDLRLIFLHDASLYDRDHLKVIIQKCEARGYQVIAEVVTNDDEVQVLFTEEVLK